MERQNDIWMRMTNPIQGLNVVVGGWLVAGWAVRKVTAIDTIGGGCISFIYVFSAAACLSTANTADAF